MFNPDCLLLYGVTHREGSRDEFYRQVEEALAGGVTLLQLREKELSDEAFLEEAAAIKAICDRHGVPLIINDRWDIALACGAAGVHVGIEDAPVSFIREKAGASFFIGATAKTVAQAKAAEASGADYLGVGALFPSPTKETAVRVTREDLAAIASATALPIVAIGGITADNAPSLKGYGACGIAVVSSLFGAPDIQAAARRLKEAALAMADRRVR